MLQAFIILILKIDLRISVKMKFVYKIRKSEIDNYKKSFNNDEKKVVKNLYTQIIYDFYQAVREVKFFYYYYIFIYLYMDSYYFLKS